MSKRPTSDSEGADFATHQALRNNIHATYPVLRIEWVRIEPAGQRGNGLVIDDAIVFRFPRTVAAVETLATEASAKRVRWAPHLSAIRAGQATL